MHVEGSVILYYSQISLRRTSLGPAPTVCLSVCLSVLQRCPSFGTGPNCLSVCLSVCLTEVSVLWDRSQLSVLQRCPSYREFSYSEMTETERQGPTPGVERVHGINIFRLPFVFNEWSLKRGFEIQIISIQSVPRGQTAEAFFVLFSGILFSIKWKHGQGCIIQLINVTIFSIYFSN